jgi:predicted NAD/FAD-dependent oxidoreductase
VAARRVAVIGGGISGVACARAAQRAGAEVTLLDRGRALGGRMASRRMRETALPYDGRVVDVGASYLTADDEEFGAVVDGWVRRDLVRAWTRSFDVRGEPPPVEPLDGPVRYAAVGGLRSLVEDLAADLPSVVSAHEVEEVTRVPGGVLVDGDRFDAVALAMPGPQALDILVEDDPAAEALRAQRWEPVLALVAAFERRTWPAVDGVFVNDSAVLSFVADDGRRRGDDAPVLVAHSTGVLAARHLDDPTSALPLLLAALGQAVPGAEEPTWVDVRRWSLAKPRVHAERQAWWDGTLGVCGDAWGARPRVQTAWLSGTYLGTHLALSGI